jgi:hypothetical protein
LRGLAYLTKSIAAPLLLTFRLCVRAAEAFKKAGLFFAAMLPAVVGWQWWVARTGSHSWDLVTLYYTNYVGFQTLQRALRDLPLVIWYNLDGFLMGAGKLLIFDVPYGSKAFGARGCGRGHRLVRFVWRCAGASSNIRWPRWACRRFLSGLAFSAGSALRFPLLSASLRLKKAVDSTPAFQPIYQAPGATVYRYQREREAPDRTATN